MDRLRCSEHFKQRFSERVTKKSRRAETFAARAFELGKEKETIADKRLRDYIEVKERSHKSSARVYHGYIYWYAGQVATTIYPIPKALKGVNL